jgi:hypothetical protein
MTTIKTKVTMKHARGVAETEVTTNADAALDVVVKETAQLGNLATKHSMRAEACIYCGSNDQLSNEHVIPYGWGGNLQIFDGSCERCRKITSQFENFSLNDGSMAHVRKERGIQSRSRDASANESMKVTLVREGVEHVETFPSSELPLILGFPWLERPGKLVDRESAGLPLMGWVTTSYGDDLQRFLSAQQATEMRVEESSKRPVAFARTLAKIAYGYAWMDGAFDVIHDGAELAQAFMQEPDRIGGFVGTKPLPFEHYPSCQFRLEYKLSVPKFLVYMEVQPFADTSAPTYEVVLGHCTSARAFRQIRRRSASTFAPSGKKA